MADTTGTEDVRPATQGLVVQVFQMLSDKVDSSHNSLRGSLDDLAIRMERRQDAHDKEDRAVADRVLVMETEHKRDMEELANDKARTQKEIDRRMGLIALLVSAIGMIVGHFWK